MGRLKIYNSASSAWQYVDYTTISGSTASYAANSATASSINFVPITSTSASWISASTRIFNSDTASTLIVESAINNSIPYWSTNSLTTRSDIYISPNRLSINGTSSTAEVLYVSGTSSISPNFIAEFSHNSNDYIQVKVENINSGNTASADFIVESDKANENLGYVDLGINSSGYEIPTFNIAGPIDGYLYVAGSGSVGGNLAIGTLSDSYILFHTSGSTSENEKLRIHKNSIQYSTPIYSRLASNITVEEDFLSSATATGQTGILGWSFTNGSIVAANSSLHHPGVITRRSGTTKYQLSEFRPSSAATNLSTALGNFDSFQWIFQPVTLTTGSLVRGGLFTSTATLAQANGIYFELSGTVGDFTYYAVYSSASTVNRASLTITASSNVWTNIGCQKLSGSYLLWTMNNTASSIMAYSSSHNATSLVFGNQLAPNSTSAADLNIDYVRLSLSGITR